MMNKTHIKSGGEITRRDTLKVAWAALGGLVSLEFGGLALSYMQPRLAEGEFGSLITVGSVDDFPPGSVTHVSNGRFYLSQGLYDEIKRYM